MKTKLYSTTVLTPLPSCVDDSFTIRLEMGGDQLRHQAVQGSPVAVLQVQQAYAESTNHAKGAQTRCQRTDLQFHTVLYTNLPEALTLMAVSIYS